VAGDEPVAAVRGDLLELADLRHAHLGAGPDPAADRHLTLDVLGQVGRVEGEDEPASARGLVQADHEALMAGGMAGGQHGGHPRRDLRVAVGDPPVERRVIEIHPEDTVAFRSGRAGHAVVQFGPLDMHGYPSGEVLQPACVVIVQVADGHGPDIGYVHAYPSERFVQRLAGPGQHRLESRVAVKPAPQRRVRDQRRVESGVQQQPAAVTFQQDAGYRLAEPLLLRRPLHRHGLGQVLPAQREQHDPADPGTHVRLPPPLPPNPPIARTG